MVAMASVALSFAMCTKHEEPKDSEEISQDESPPTLRSLEQDRMLGSQPTQKSPGLGQVAVKSQAEPLACQPLPWPEVRQIARRNPVGQRGPRHAKRARPSMGAKMRPSEPAAEMSASMSDSAGAGPSKSVASASPVARSAGKGSAGGAVAPGGLGTLGRMKKEAPSRRPAGLLTAGEWRDLDHWGFWRGLFNAKRQETSQWKDMQSHWGFSLRNRVSLQVKAGSEPATNVSVYLQDGQGNTLWKARSDNQGMAHLFPQWHKGPYSVCAALPGVAGKKMDIELQKGAALVDIGLNTAATRSKGLDVMFMVDTTGSMGDELSYLQSELRNVLSKVKEDNANVDIRTSVNFYRDSTDEYVVRPFAFTRDISKARRQIENQSANGGGDFPEAVDEALTNAIFEHKWREDAKARIVFLVLDAPPHTQKKNLVRVRRAVRQAAEQGIRIVPVAGSGIDKPTEFLMRFAAVATGGTYAFLTDDSGIGNSHLKPTIGKHKVQKLNRLLVKIINRYAE